MNLNFKEFGQGFPIIILHGLFGTLDNWQTIAKKLAENFSVYILDQRNHGRSPHANFMDYQSMSEDLKNFMESQWIFEANIIGHSMGGKTAMQFALDYPEMTKKLVVVDIAPKKYTERHNHIFKALMSLDLDNLKSRQEIDDILQSQIKDYGERQFLLKNLTRKKEGGFQFKMNLSIIHQHYPQILAAIENEEIFEKSSLFIKGGISKHILEGDEEKIFEIFPNARIETIEGAGHWVHADKPQELHSLIKTFLD